MMKKIIAFALGLAMTLTLAACGQPGASASQPAASNPPEETEAASALPAEIPDASTPQPEQADIPDSESG